MGKQWHAEAKRETMFSFLKRFYLSYKHCCVAYRIYPNSLSAHTLFQWNEKFVGWKWTDRVIMILTVWYSKQSTVLFEFIKWQCDSFIGLKEYGNLCTGISINSSQRESKPGSTVHLINYLHMRNCLLFHVALHVKRNTRNSIFTCTWVKCNHYAPLPAHTAHTHNNGNGKYHNNLSVHPARCIQIQIQNETEISQFSHPVVKLIQIKHHSRFSGSSKMKIKKKITQIDRRKLIQFVLSLCLTNCSAMSWCVNLFCCTLLHFVCHFYLREFRFCFSISKIQKSSLERFIWIFPQFTLRMAQ